MFDNTARTRSRSSFVAASVKVITWICETLNPFSATRRA